jgi:hypothetical protein
MSTEALMFAIKLAHTAVFAFVSACILYVLYCGVVGWRSRWLRAAIWIPTFVGLAWWVNGRICPVASLIYWLSGDPTASDIFLPGWFSRRVVPGSALALMVGIALVLWRKHAHKWRGAV